MKFQTGWKYENKYQKLQVESSFWENQHWAKGLSLLGLATTNKIAEIKKKEKLTTFKHMINTDI